ncbi:MAG: RtcB family protein [Candidatus Pacearchaeota archaeon]
MNIRKVSDFEWEIPQEGGMNVPCRIFASERLLEDMKKDRCLEQVKNVARLPGIILASFAMPDAHQGYGFPIGGVAAFDVEKGVISPGGVGYDINCSVRLLSTNLKKENIKGREKEVIHSLFRVVPSGVGIGSKMKLDYKKLDEVLTGGARWAIENGFGLEEDCLFIEEGGKMENANPKDVSRRAKGRGLSQLGTLGAGNHFLEIQVVDEIFDEGVAKEFGLEKGQIVIMIHCGSRGLGHQVASDYIKLMDEKYGHPDFDRELVNASINSELGKAYLSAMACSANFAFANKQIITHLVREDLKHYFPKIEVKVVYDLCHNIAKFEKHLIGKFEKEVLVIRKGATRSFGPERVEIPEKYKMVGQPVLIPGSMGTSSYVLCGTKIAEEKSFGSTAHGAGRLKSRISSKKDLTFEKAKKEMEEIGVEVESGSVKGLIEEMPSSYKDIDEVVRVSEKAGLGKIVARLKPLAVMKG